MVIVLVIIIVILSDFYEDNDDEYDEKDFDIMLIEKRFSHSIFSLSFFPNSSFQ